MKRKAFQEVRLVVYAAFVLNCVLVQYILPTKYLCDYTEQTCPMCGMRTAVDYITKLRFKDAYEANQYIVVLLIIGLIVLIDSIVMIRKWKESKQRIILSNSDTLITKE